MGHIMKKWTLEKQHLSTCLLTSYLKLTTECFSTSCTHIVNQSRFSGLSSPKGKLWGIKYTKPNDNK